MSIELLPKASPQLVSFIRESNAIEGILREPTSAEIDAADRIMAMPRLSVVRLNEFQAVCAPGHPLREHPGMDVRVGCHVAPPGGPNIKAQLKKLIDEANAGDKPWRLHCWFEFLHPYLDGNGRTGRMLWLWMMRDREPFGLPFLHRFYYQTLEGQQ